MWVLNGFQFFKDGFHKSGHISVCTFESGVELLTLHHVCYTKFVTSYVGTHT